MENFTDYTDSADSSLCVSEGDTSVSFSDEHDVSLGSESGSSSESFSESLAGSLHTSNSSDLEEADDDICDDVNVHVHHPLYSGSKLSTFESYLLIMRYGLRHGLTKQALSDLLNLVGMHLPNDSMVSLYKLKKFFVQLYEDHYTLLLLGLSLTI